MKTIILWVVAVLLIAAAIMLLQLYFDKTPNECREDSMIPFLFRMAKIEESAVIEKPVHEVFAFVTDPAHASVIAENIVDVVPITEGPVKVGSRYSQTRMIHGNKNPQEIEVTIYKEDELYAIKTKLFGLDVTYTYQFTPADASATTLHLTKHACGARFMKLVTPLLKHLFTRPEHDGNHINVLKQAVEGQ